MAALQLKISKAYTLVEVMLAVAMICVISVGALEYQFYAAKDSRIAKVQTTAARTAQLLLDDWKSVGGSTTYNPVSLNLGFTSGSIPTGYMTGYALGSTLNNAVYNVNVNNVPMVIVLCWNDVSTGAGGTTLRQLTVMVKWQMGEAVGTGGTSLCTSPVIMSSYIRLDS